MRHLLWRIQLLCLLRFFVVGAVVRLYIKETRSVTMNIFRKK